MADKYQLLNGWLAIDYEMGVEPYIWRDTISGPAEVITKMSDAAVEAEKKRRYDAWIAIIQPDNGEL